MSRKIFINLPVTDLGAAKSFYAALGFTEEPNFSDETAACMVWSETIMVMLLTHAKWREFTARPIPGKGSSEVMLALSFDDKAAVETVTEAAGANGGISDVNPAQDHGFMVSRAFADRDGHVWEAFWMDPAMAEAGTHEASAA